MTKEKFKLRTQQEIITKIDSFKGFDDMFGVKRNDCIVYLTFENAKKYLKPSVTGKKWDKDYKKLTAESILKEMEDYMSFAWDKANCMRGISANRSIDHFGIWIWLLGEDDFYNEIIKEFKENYYYYGKPILEKICKRYGWDWKKWDDGKKTNG